VADGSHRERARRTAMRQQLSLRCLGLRDAPLPRQAHQTHGAWG